VIIFLQNSIFSAVGSIREGVGRFSVSLIYNEMIDNDNEMIIYIHF